MNDGLDLNQSPIESAPEMAAPAEQRQERMISQSEVDKLIHATKREAEEKAARKMQNMDRTVGLGGQESAPRQMNEDELVEKAMAKMRADQENQHNHSAAQKILGDFSTKMKNGQTKYDDFDKSISRMRLEKMPDVIRMATQHANTEDVMYELSKKPMKLAAVRQLIADEQFDMAEDAIKEIAESMAYNEKAIKKAPMMRQPLSEMKASAKKTGAEDKRMTLEEMRKQSFTRG